MDNHKQWKNKFDLNTNNESNNLIFIPILTGKKTHGKRDKIKLSASFIPSLFFSCLFRQ